MAGNTGHKFYATIVNKEENVLRKPDVFMPLILV